MITPLVEMLKLPKFDRMITSAIKFKSHDKILLVLSWTEIMTSSPLFQNTFFKKGWSNQFAVIIKLVSKFIIATFKGSKKVKRNSKFILKCNLYLYFLI